MSKIKTHFADDDTLAYISKLKSENEMLRKALKSENEMLRKALETVATLRNAWGFHKETNESPLDSACRVAKQAPEGGDE